MPACKSARTPVRKDESRRPNPELVAVAPKTVCVGGVVAGVVEQLGDHFLVRMGATTHLLCPDGSHAPVAICSKEVVDLRIKCAEQRLIANAARQETIVAVPAYPTKLGG